MRGQSSCRGSMPFLKIEAMVSFPTRYWDVTLPPDPLPGLFAAGVCFSIRLFDVEGRRGVGGFVDAIRSM